MRQSTIMFLTVSLCWLSLCTTLHAAIFFQSETFYFQSLPSSNRGHGVAVTGGGLVRSGENVTLRLNTTQQWSRCFWFRQDSKMAGGYDSCRMEFNTTTNRSQLGTCKPNDFKDVIHLDPEHPRDCAIKLYNVSQSLMGLWAARLEEDMSNEEITLSMATPANVSIDVLDPEVIENHNFTIRCTASGGNPKPVLYLGFVDKTTQAPQKTKAETNTSLSNDPAFLELLYTYSNESASLTVQGRLTAVSSLSGRIPVCWTDQRGSNNLSYFQQTATYKEGLDIHMKPKLFGSNVTEFTVEAIIGDVARLEARIVSNPAPQASWSARYPGCNTNSIKQKEENCNKTVSIGQQNARYIISNITKVNSSEANLWQVGLTVQNLTKMDANLTYLLILNNTAGSLEVNFKIRAVLITTTSTTSRSTSTTPVHLDVDKHKGGGAALTILAIFAILGILTAVGIIVYRRRFGNSEESAPLTEQRVP